MNEQVKSITSWLGTGSIDLFGCPFSGKDTQGRILADLFDGVLIAGGDILRTHHDPEKIKQILASGGIVPSDFYENLILPYLSRPEYGRKPLILSAVGRAHGEESIVMKAADDSGHPLQAVILLDLPEAEVWRRFETAQAQHDRGQRADDRQSVLNTRLQKFQVKTQPVIEFYRDKGLLITIDGALSRDTVTSEILKGLLSYSSR